MPSPPPVLLGLEDDRSRRWVLSSGKEPAAALVQVGGVLFGAVAVVELLDDEAANVTCQMWVKELPRPWREVDEFGATYRAPMKPRFEPHVLVLGGLDFETDAGDERYILSVCGELGRAAAAAVIVGDTEHVRIEASDRGSFFSVLFAVAPVGEGVDPTVVVQPVA